jgi:hypothetical protein
MVNIFDSRRKTAGNKKRLDHQITGGEKRNYATRELG